MRKNTNKHKTVLIGICAGIAAYKTYDIINALRDDNINTIACMSRDAHHFVSPLVLQTLSGHRVFQDMFAPQQEFNPIHISLAQKTDIILVVPATSDVISKVASGICDDLLTCTIASTAAPVLFAPAMNEAMYYNRILQANLNKLKKLNYQFIGPTKGRLACGAPGMGHIADIKHIVNQTKTLLAQSR
jgi:phosphopantothenoylcysteine decarboxylase / phosphopantothenate---cysteine ligase